MIVPAILAAISIAFPQEGRKLPAVDRCYVIGAVHRPVTNVTVSSSAAAVAADFAVYRTGAWAATVAVSSGVNRITVSAPDGTSTNVSVFVAAKPSASVASTNAPAKPYEKLAYSADAPKDKPARTKPSEFLVAIDPGHGGSDHGAVSPHGGFEKEANLAVAKAVKKNLESRGFKVMMTRDRDVRLELKERPHEAHRRGADLFVSLHHNAPAESGDPTETRFFSTYCWNDLGEAPAKLIEAKMAELLVPAGIPSGGVLRRNFAVTRSNEIPSVLVECDFITSPAGEERIVSRPDRAALAAAIADGIAAFLLGK